MKKIMISAISLALCGLASTTAQEKVLVNGTDNISNGTKVENVGRISFNEAETELSITTLDETVTPFTIDDIVDVTFEDVPDAVQIIYSEGDARIINPFACEGVTATKSGADVTITATTDATIEYILSGTASDGSLKLFNTGKATISLKGVSLTNPDCPAISVQGAGAATIKLASGTSNTLADGADYVIPDGESAKGAVYVKGKLTIEGDGSLHVSSAYKHAIVADKSITVNGGNITVDTTVSDAFHSKKGFTMNGGNLTLAAEGDGIDGDADIVEIKGGTLSITVAVDAAKGLKTDGNIAISGGTITINATGGVEVTDGDPSYCTAIKADGTVDITGGDITIISTGEAGKGISADGDINISGGTIDITTSGNGATYTDTTGTLDSYSATCIKADGNINITGGSIAAKSSGSAGKGISSDGDMTIGGVEGIEPTINVSTTGAKFLVSNSSGSTGGWGGGPGGMDNADYANPKAIKADGNLTINSGKINVSTQQDGGEGLESKKVLTINGGTIEAITYDDAINAAQNITINGGMVYCYASGNDGMDSNGTININGGVVISSGTSQPEEGIDCDQNTFTITGGILIGTGGATSTPTASTCTQRSVIYNFSSATSGQIINIQQSGETILTYKMPRSYNSCCLLFSSPKLASGTTYTIYKGGSVSGGTEFNGYVDGGTYTAGTQATTFTPSSMVTTIGSSSGGRPW